MPCRAGASGITVDGVGNPKMETISIKVSAELSARVSRLAARKATTRSAVIRAAIEAYSGDEERSFWRRTLSEGRIEAADLERAIRLMHTHRAIETTLERARQFGAGARDALAGVPAGPATRALDDVVEFCIARAN